MDIYKLTVFETNGDIILDESFEAKDDNEAKRYGEKRLSELGAMEKTHRCSSPKGKLILFHP